LFSTFFFLFLFFFLLLLNCTYHEDSREATKLFLSEELIGEFLSSLLKVLINLTNDQKEAISIISDSKMALPLSEYSITL